MSYVAVDIESLGTVPGSIVLSIGAVRFDDKGLLNAHGYESADEAMRNKARCEFYREITLASCGGVGLTFSHETLAWWLKQSDAARRVLVNALEGNGTQDIRQVMGDFKAWLETGDGCQELWSWGQFDLPLLKTVFDRLGVTKPWDYKIERDARTLARELPVVIGVHRVGVAHHAFDDAVWCANQVVAMKQYLQRAAEGERTMRHMEFQKQLLRFSGGFDDAHAPLTRWHAEDEGGLPMRDQYGNKIDESGTQSPKNEADAKDSAEGEQHETGE